MCFSHCRENDCSTIFCKAIHLQDEMQALGYGFADVLLDTTEGSLSPAVWDLFLYSLLLQSGEQELSDGFLAAVTSGDEETKWSYQEHYMTYTIESIQQFVDNLLKDVGELTNKARTYDQTKHPRVPIIMAHNNLVLSTFLKVKANLANMMEEQQEEVGEDESGQQSAEESQSEEDAYPEGGENPDGAAEEIEAEEEVL